MSATLQAEPIARYLGNCPAIESRGRTFPVDVRYLPHLDRRPLADLVEEGVAAALERSAGDSLVFLPGVGEIRQCEKRLAHLATAHNLALLPLYGDLPADRQDAVLQPHPNRKLILATNVAETSLTIEGITTVVDSGLARMLRYDDRTGLDRLELGPISQASADQRAGRAGRTQPGICLRLWPEAAHRSRPAFERPEIERVDLAGAVLQVLCWIEPDLQKFSWFEPPPPSFIQRAQQLLVSLEAADTSGVTSLGRRIAALPVHPRIGRLLLEADRRDCLREAALAATLLSERDPFLRSERRADDRKPSARRRPSQHSTSDVLDRVEAISQFEQTGADEFEFGRLNIGAAKHLLRSRDQLLRAIDDRSSSKKSASPHQTADSAFLRSLLAAYPDRLARRREPGSRRGLMVGGRGVRLADESALGDEELYVCVDVDAGGSEALVRQASAVDRAWLPPHQITTETVTAFDEATEKITVLRRESFSGLVLAESQLQLPAGDSVAESLAAAAATRLNCVLPADDPDFASFLARSSCLAQWLPELELPSLGEDQLRSLLPQLAAGRRSFAELRQAPWLDVIKGLFTWQQLQTIEREAPERVEVPSGSQISLQYELSRPPILAVRIQEVFGMFQTPRIARGRVPVLMHLLAPNMRVAQVTDDLASFWANTYLQVRKDLRARYPKHSWPEDPYTAQPQRRPGRKS